MLWLLVPILLLQAGNDTAVCSFELIAKTKLVVIDWNGTCHRSDDAGKTWADSSATWMRKTLAVSDQEIWGITANELNERIACTVNGGKDWTSVLLDRNGFHPMAFVGVRNGCPLLVDQLGQVRQWKRSESPKSDGSDWVPLGVPVPVSADYASSGCLVDETLYVGSPGKIWWSTDLCMTWKSFDCGVKAPVVEFAASTSSCWAVTREGILFHAVRGMSDWTKMAAIQKAWFVFGLAATEEGVFVAGREDPPRAILVFVRTDGKINDCSIPSKDQLPVSVRVDDKKEVWVATVRGLFHRRADEWIEAWPAK